jgi:hypothetical protein
MSTPPVALDSIVTLGPTFIVTRDDSGDGRIVADRFGCSSSDLILWNPHAGSYFRFPMKFIFLYH